MRVDLMLGDCLERMKEIPDQSLDMIMCDLPYGTTACAWDSVIPFAPLWEQYWRICKGAVVLNATQPFASHLMLSQNKYFKYEWIWSKNLPTGYGSASFMPMRSHENILVFSKNKTVFNKQLVKSKMTDRKLDGKGWKRGNTKLAGAYGELDNVGSTQTLKEMVSPRTVLDIACVPRASGTFHPTQKPVALMDYMIRTYTNPGDVVLDNCMGSGTTGVAAIEACRSFIGIERNEGYFAIAEKRIKGCETYKLLWGED